MGKSNRSHNSKAEGGSTPVSATSTTTTPPSKYRKKAPKSPPKPQKVEASSTRNANDSNQKVTNVLTCKLRSGDIIALTRTNRNKHAYVTPLVKYLKNPDNGDFVKGRLGIHYIGWEVDPTNPTSYKEDFDPNKPLQPRYHVFINTVADDMVHKNTPANRKKFASRIISLNNNAKIQSKYLYGGQLMVYAGDISAEDDSDAPPLSKYLTIGDTMDFVRTVYENLDTGEKPSITAVLNQQDWLNAYYSKDLIPKLKKLYGHKDKEDGIENNMTEDEDNISVPEFTL